MPLHSSRREFLQRSTLGLGALAFLPYCTSRSNEAADSNPEAPTEGKAESGGTYTNPVYAGSFPTHLCCGTRARITPLPPPAKARKKTDAFSLF
ncbi:twin-arginine translocation signal domain-containing protein [Hymenobacter radiodurans]|uniref:twin-arginine translocation signal domain-containing protein n=1 Tax=Hymenobacter radiodurans TaxID=2496028 RepID=UPI001058D167